MIFIPAILTGQLVPPAETCQQQARAPKVPGWGSRPLVMAPSDAPQSQASWQGLAVIAQFRARFIYSDPHTHG